MAMLQTRAKIIFNKKLKCGYWLLEFESRLIAKSACPGQFIEVKVSDNLGPLLRRPISIHSIGASKVRLLYEVIGEGTQALSNRRAGEFLDLIGPLGRGFHYSLIRKAVNPHNIIVAGGMGVAPLVFLAERIKSIKPLVLLGARSADHILCRSEFRTLGCKVITATDDGSSGFKGRVTDLLNKILSDKPQIKPQNIYACGPQPMLEAVARISCGHNIASQLSLERHMACGFGACLGCVVSTKSGYKRACKDGPVFTGEELTW